MFPRNQNAVNRPTNVQGTRRALRVSNDPALVSLVFVVSFGLNAPVLSVVIYRMFQIASRTMVQKEQQRASNANTTVNVREDIEVLENVDFPAMDTRHDVPAPASTNMNAANVVSGNKLSYQYSGQVDDIDERDSDDPLCATSYVQDMYDHFRSKEVFTSVRPVYMEDQQFINERMRSILVDWLVEVHLKFKLVPETLYLTVNIIDRYLAKTEVTRPKLQLVGVTSLLIASKYEEIYPPELRDLVFICDNAYSKLEVSLTIATILTVILGITLLILNSH